SRWACVAGAWVAAFIAVVPFVVIVKRPFDCPTLNQLPPFGYPCAGITGLAGRLPAPPAVGGPGSTAPAIPRSAENADRRPGRAAAWGGACRRCTCSIRRSGGSVRFASRDVCGPPDVGWG